MSIEIHLGRFEHGWRLQVYPACVKFVENCTDKYTGETTASIKWEAFKTHIKGEIISCTSFKTKGDNHELH